MKKKVLLPETEQSRLITANSQIDWTSDPSGGIVLENRSLGVQIKRFAVLSESGEYLYDTFGIAERPGNPVCVVVDHLGRIGLLREYRVMPERQFWACPRGFSKAAEEGGAVAAKREVLEELGFTNEETVASAECLGQLYQNTTFFINPVVVFLVKVALRSTEDPHVKTEEQKKEDIRSIHFLEPEGVWRMIANGEVSCNMTLAALMLYFSKIKAFQEK